MNCLDRRFFKKKLGVLFSAVLMLIFSISAFEKVDAVFQNSPDDYFEKAYELSKDADTIPYSDTETKINTSSQYNYFGNELSNVLKDYIVAESYSNPNIKSDENSSSASSSLVVSRGLVSRTKYGQALDWWSEVKGKLINKDDILVIKDFETGTAFKLIVEGGTNHADVEPLTSEDSEIIKSLWGGSYNWSRRPVLVFTKSNVIAASLNGMPHAGSDSEPYRAVVPGRSAGYGEGINYDMVKGNGVDGHLCLHFKNSTLHKNQKKDPLHQQAVMKASGE